MYEPKKLLSNSFQAIKKFLVFTSIDSPDNINAIYCLEFKISFQSHFQQTLQNSICNKMKS